MLAVTYIWNTRGRPGCRSCKHINDLNLVSNYLSTNTTIIIHVTLLSVSRTVLGASYRCLLCRVMLTELPTPPRPQPHESTDVTDAASPARATVAFECTPKQLRFAEPTTEDRSSLSPEARPTSSSVTPRVSFQHAVEHTKTVSSVRYCHEVVLPRMFFFLLLFAFCRGQAGHSSLRSTATFGVFSMLPVVGLFSPLFCRS